MLSVHIYVARFRQILLFSLKQKTTLSFSTIYANCAQFDLIKELDSPKTTCRRKGPAFTYSSILKWLSLTTDQLL